MLLFSEVDFIFIMKIVIGLGIAKNEDCRHSVGFQSIIDYISQNVDITEQEFKSYQFFATLKMKIFSVNLPVEVLLIKPLVHINDSGLILKELLEVFDISLRDILIIYDDIDLNVGELRLKRKGSANGHNGIMSIIKTLGTEKFNRLKIGVGRPKNKIQIKEYLLSPFESEELKKIHYLNISIFKIIEVWCLDGIEKAMNQFN